MTVNVEQKAKDVLATLYQIQPQITMSDLDPDDIDRVTEMKTDLVALVKELTADNQRLARVVGCSREDAVSCFNEIRQLAHTAAVTGMTDKVLQEAIHTAEAFVERGRAYLSYKERLHTSGGA